VDRHEVTTNKPKQKPKAQNKANKTQKAKTHNKQTKRRRDRCQFMG